MRSGAGGPMIQHTLCCRHLRSYKPRVTTWGVFPRPSNISQAYGGGRNIRPGQALETAEQRAKREVRLRMHGRWLGCCHAQHGRLALAAERARMLLTRPWTHAPAVLCAV